MTDTDSPSGSLALEAQVTVSVCSGIVLERVGVCTDGARLLTVTEAELESEPPLLSDADATQVILSVGLTV